MHVRLWCVCPSFAFVCTRTVARCICVYTYRTVGTIPYQAYRTAPYRREAMYTWYRTVHSTYRRCVTDRQTERETARQRGREREVRIVNVTVHSTYRTCVTDRQTERETARQRGNYAPRFTCNRQTDRATERERERGTYRKCVAALCRTVSYVSASFNTQDTERVVSFGPRNYAPRFTRNLR
jgi:hypothetical protein